MEIDSSSLYATIIEYQAGELHTAEAYDDTEGDDVPAMTEDEMDRLAANIASMFMFEQGIRKMLERRINVELQNEQFNKLLNKLIKKRPDPAPKIELDITAYKLHSPPLQVKYSKDYV